MKGSGSSFESFVVASQAAAACGLSEASLNHPPLRQQYEAAFSFGMLDHFQLDALRHVAPGEELFKGLLSRP